jgi:hypothetical protein
VASTNVSARRRPPTPPGFHSPRLAPVASAAWVVALLRCKFPHGTQEPAGQPSASTARCGTPSSERCISRGRAHLRSCCSSRPCATGSEPGARIVYLSGSDGRSVRGACARGRRCLTRRLGVLNGREEGGRNAPRQRTRHRVRLRMAWIHYAICGSLRPMSNSAAEPCGEDAPARRPPACRVLLPASDSGAYR